MVTAVDAVNDDVVGDDDVKDDDVDGDDDNVGGNHDDDDDVGDDDVEDDDGVGYWRQTGRCRSVPRSQEALS